jgi:hypothetical protein
MSPTSSRGFIAKHWNGEYSFPRSFWLNMILISWLLPLLAMVAQGITAPNLSPRLSSGGYLGASAIQIVLLTWGACGALRSTKRHLENGGSKRWHLSALIVIFFLAADTMVPILRAPGLLYANVRMVVTGRYGPAATVSLMNHGTSALIHGSLQDGSADELFALMNKAPEVSTVELDSSGGLFTEAVKMANIISDRHLNTYVEHDCSSACTFIFLAGKNRCLSPSAKLGFHAGYRVNVAPGISSLNMDGFQRDHYRTAGLPAEFIDRILATPNTTLWRPTRAELSNAHVTTPDCERRTG